jgi:hypothetical protein
VSGFARQVSFFDGLVVGLASYRADDRSLAAGAYTTISKNGSSRPTQGRSDEEAVSQVRTSDKCELQ